jgi:hypothetical protein
MRLNRTIPWIACALLVVCLVLRGSRGAGAQTTVAQEAVAVFSVCDQAPAAAREVQAKVNAWFDERDHRSVQVLQREMFTAPCPGAVQFGSVAITLAVHYRP